jgi:hypothetical protein
MCCIVVLVEASIQKEIFWSLMQKNVFVWKADEDRCNEEDRYWKLFEET